ncbi:MAG: RbsD/FucU domain-containing protein, partial [Mangrovicoccus sp.]
LPGFFPVLDAILTELHIEASCIADEVNGALEDAFAQRLSPDRMSHKRLKENLKNARAIIRTGDMTPFANVMLTSGVTY